MLEEKLKQAPAPSGKSLDSTEEDDVKMATSMAASVMSMPEMTSALVQQTQNAQPEMAIGQYVAETILALKEQADKNGLKFSDRIWMADGGVADRLVDQAILNIVAGGGPDLDGAEDMIMGEVLEVFKMLSKGGQPAQGSAGALPPGMPANPGVPRPGAV